MRIIKEHQNILTMNTQELKQRISDLFVTSANEFRFSRENYDLPQSEIERILGALSPKQLKVVLTQPQKWRSKNGDKFNCLQLKGGGVYKIFYQKKGYYCTPEKTSPEINVEERIA